MENPIYVVDTTGTWMLDALFNDELRRLEPRSYEYLVHFINAFCHPNSKFIGIVPSGKRSEKPMAKSHKELEKRTAISAYTAIGESNLAQIEENLEAQINYFARLTNVKKKSVLQFAAFHCHDLVKDGFFYATGGDEPIPGVPLVVNEYWEKNNFSSLFQTDKDEEIIQIKRAFSIYQRGYKYALKAFENDAIYLTSPYRWATTGVFNKTMKLDEPSILLGSIAVAAIENGNIRSASDLVEKLMKLKDKNQTWREELEKLRLDLCGATSKKQKEMLKSQLYIVTNNLLVGWSKEELNPFGITGAAAVVGTVWSILLYKSGLLDTSFSTFLGGSLGAISSIFSPYITIGKCNGKFLRHVIETDLPNVLLSCKYCGAPMSSKKNISCKICDDGKIFNNKYFFEVAE